MDAVDAELAKRAKITSDIVDQLENELLTLLRQVPMILYPFVDLTEDQIECIVLLAVLDRERFSKLQGRLYRACARKNWKQVNLEELYADRIRKEKAEQELLRKAGSVDGNRDKGKGIPDIDGVLDDFNEQWLHVRMGSEEGVMEIETLDLVRKNAFIGLHEHDVVKDGVNERGEPILVNKAKAWLKHRQHAIARAGLVFEPDKPGGFLKGRKIGKTYNTWTGFDVQPIAGDVSLFRELVNGGLCGGHGVQSDYMWNLYAWMFQNPGKVTSIYTVLAHKAEGIGKGFFGHAICNIFGKHGRFVNDQDYITGRFNYSTLGGKCFATLDEASFAGNKRDAAKLRSLISEEKITIERKYFDAEQVTNHLNFLLLTNAWHATDASMTSRRPFIPDIVEWRRGDQAYWTGQNNALYANDRRGLSALLHAFLHTDVSTFNPRSLPQTQAVIDQRIRTARHEPWGFFRDMLARGYPCRSRFGHETDLHIWMIVCSTLWLHLGYMQWCDDHRIGEHRRLGLDDFGQFIARELKLDPVYARNVVVGENSTQGADGILRARKNSYRLGSLEEFESLIAARMAGDTETVLSGDPSDAEPDPGDPSDQGSFDYDHDPE